MVTENPRPAKVFAVVNDLFFEAKIGEVLRTLGIPIAFAKSEDGLSRRLDLYLTEYGYETNPPNPFRGVWPDVQTGVSATVTPRETIDPIPEWVEIYRERREQYRALYPALRDLRPDA